MLPRRSGPPRPAKGGHPRLAVFALVAPSRLKIEAFSDVTNVEFIVITLYPGAAAEESGER
jgi:hypothetical protein